MRARGTYTTKPGDRCPSCDFTVPADTKHAVNAMTSHRRNAHEGWAERKRIKPQFQALVEATGSLDLALHFADRVIIWDRPPEMQLRAWAIEAVLADDNGQPVVSQRQVDRMERRLRKAEEWDARKTNALNRQVLQEAGQGFLDGKITLQQMGTAYRYAGDNWHWGEKAVKEAYSKDRPEQVVPNTLIQINAGAPPPKRLKAGKPAERVIDAEVRELASNPDAPDV